jgi:hypothetical protein
MIIGEAHPGAALDVLRWRDVAVPVGRSPSVGSQPAPAWLHHTLEVVRGHLLRAGGGRTSPSAGGIYPFEIWAYDAESGALGSVDLSRRSVLTRGGARFDGVPDLLFVLRPWLSTRKYGARGVAYGLLDLGHALFNLQLATAGSDARLRIGGDACVPGLPIGRLGVARLRGEPAGPGGESGWRIDDVGPQGVLAEVGDYEASIAQRLVGNWALPALDLVPSGDHDLIARLSRTLHPRRSAAAFAGGLAARRVTEVLDAGVSAWRALAGGLNVPGIRAAVFTRERAPELFTRENFFYQDHLTTADALITVSVPVPAAQAPIAGDVAVSLLAAGLLGQCLYLSATDRDIAVTGVGGFVPAAFQTAEDVWPVYCLAFGLPFTSPPAKDDTQAITRAGVIRRRCGSAWQCIPG